MSGGKLGIRPARAQRRWVIVACGWSAAGLGLTACGGAAGGTSAINRPAPLVAAPLATTFATTSGSVAVVAMGDLVQPLNTFWQLVYRPDPGARWSLITPPAVADNGGLVVTGGARAALNVGFEPSQALRISPIAQSPDAGATWVPGLVPGSLEPVPDALAGSSNGALFALVRPGGGRVLVDTGRRSAWDTVVSRDTLSSSASGRSCGVGTLRAVASAAGGVLVATTCSKPGVVGIFARTAGGWHLVGPSLRGALGTEPATTLRLVPAGVGAFCTLVGVRRAKAVGVVAAWTGDDGRTWSESRELDLGTAGTLVSSGFGPGGSEAVLSKSPRGAENLAVVDGPDRPWQHLPAPPPGTQTVALGANGVVDALVVRAATVLTDWRLETTSGTWSKMQTMQVPIQFGSSG